MLMTAKEMTRYRRGLGSVGWLVDHCCPQLSFHFSERRTRENDATIQAMRNLNKIILSATTIEWKLMIRKITVSHLCFVGVHDAAHANVNEGASQQAHGIFA